MRRPSDNARYLNLVMVSFLVGVFVFASPFHRLWMTPETPWYVPYLIWLAVIVMTGVVQLARGRDEL